MSYAMTGPGSLTAARTLRREDTPTDAAHMAGNSAAAVRRVPLPIDIANAADALLVERAANGDVAAFGVLVQRYQRPMASLISRMVDSPEDVDDIVQELFLRAWKGLPRFRGDAQFSTWIYRIAVNTAIKHRSRRRNETTLAVSAEDLARGMESLEAPPDASPSMGGDPFLSIQREEDEARVRHAVRLLPEKQRAVVVLHYFEGQTCEEISRVVGCSLGTVWSRLHYACKRMRSVLEATE